MVPADFEVKQPGAEEAVGVIGLIGRARVVSQHIEDQLLFFFFKGTEYDFGFRRKGYGVGRLRRLIGKRAVGFGMTVGVGNVRFNVQNRGSVQKIAAGQFQGCSVYRFELNDGQADRVGTEWRPAGENADPLIAAEPRRPDGRLKRFIEMFVKDKKNPEVGKFGNAAQGFFDIVRRQQFERCRRAFHQTRLTRNAEFFLKAGMDGADRGHVHAVHFILFSGGGKDRLFSGQYKNSWKSIPAMGVPGAALATGVSRMLTLGFSLSMLHFRYHMLTREWTGWSALLRAWKNILFVAAPAAMTNLLQPITAGVIVRIIAGFGQASVAATTAGQRIESFAYMIPMAMGTTLVPIIGQNWGSGKLERVRGAWIRTNWYGIIYSVLILLVALVCAPAVAGWFSTDPDVVRLIAVYLRIMLFGAILLHSTVHTGFAFNAVGMPLRASLLTIIRLVGLVLPLAWLGSRVAGVPGVYAGMAVGHILAGTVALLWFGRTLRSKQPTV